MLRKGFTTIELLVVITIMGLATVSVLGYFKLHKNFPRARDNDRLVGLASLDMAINQYRLDNNAYPGVSGVLYTSHTLPANASDLASSDHGWIDENLASYTSRLSLDPINNVTYHFSYIHTANTYELNATLEYLTEEMSSDGGSSDNVYEVGNNLNLILP